MSTAYQRFTAATGDDMVSANTFRCPAHSDRPASGSVHESRDGIVVHCHAGCETSAVVAALGLQMSDLFNEPRERKRSFADRIVATYPYHDADGVLSYEIVRLEDPKDFRPRKPNGEWNRQGCAPLLYGLPAVNAAKESGETVYYFEGEKDCDNARRLGLCATTHASGAKGWKQTYADQLEGIRDLVIVPDNDEPGLALAVEIAVAVSKLSNPPKIRVLSPLMP